MDAFYLLNLQSTLSLVVFALIAKWYITPRISKLELEDALLPLVLVHAFRYTPMTLLVPGQVAADIPAHVVNSIAYGDLASGLLALIAAVLLKHRISGAIIVTWIFNIVGMIDIINALVQGVGAQLYKYALGFN